MPSILNATTTNGLVTSADNSGELQLQTNNGTTAVTVTTGQNVGIGTSNPGAKVEVFTGSTIDGIRIRRFSGAYYSDIRHTDNPEGLAFLIGDGSTVAERMRITGTGNLQFNSGYGSVATAYGCRAWVNYNGVSQSVRASGNVSSVTRNGTGLYTINFSTAMPNTNYAVVATGGYWNVTNSFIQVNQGSVSTSSFQLANVLSAGGATETDQLQIAVFR